MNGYSDHTHPDDQSDFKALIDLATPDIYEHNAFRLLETHVEATDRELSKRKQLMEAATRNSLPVPGGPCRIFPRVPAPDDHEIRECAHAIEDAERRLAQEFFWFWPLTVGRGGDDECLPHLHKGDCETPAKAWRDREQSPDEGPAAKHNLAVLYHFAALEMERTFVNGNSAPLSTERSAAGNQREPAKAADAEQYWTEANRYWNMVAVEQSCWSRVVARIRAMDDKSLTTGAAGRMERALPVALALIMARLAIRFHQQGKQAHAKRHAARLRISGFPAEALDKALRIALGPTRATIKTFCEAAKHDTESDPAKADAVTERLLDQAAESLALVDLLLPEDAPVRAAEHDQIALAALFCAIRFGNKTDDYERCQQLYAKFSPLAASAVARERIKHNADILRGNLENSRCFFCKRTAANEGSAINVSMHGDVRRIPNWDGIRITWRHTTVGVPRCSACEVLHGKLENTGFAIGCGGVLAAVCVILACILVSGGAWEGSLVALLAAIGACAWCGWGLENKPPAGRTLPKESHKEHPRIKELLAEGWTWGESPNTE